MSYTDYAVESFNREMSRLNAESRRIAAMKKRTKLEFQKMCHHPKVMHVMGRIKPDFLSYQSSLQDAVVKVKVKCVICGKVL